MDIFKIGQVDCSYYSNSNNSNSSNSSNSSTSSNK